MTTLGIIGAGNIGSQVARLALSHGAEVVISNSRGPETLVSLVEELGDHARAATSTEAAQDAEIAVVTIPVRAIADVPVEPLAGKIVLDTNNYYPQRDGQIPELDDQSSTSSELLQRHLPTSKVVKAFNHIYAAAITEEGVACRHREPPRARPRGRRRGGQGHRRRDSSMAGASTPSTWGPSRRAGASSPAPRRTVRAGTLRN